MVNLLPEKKSHLGMVSRPPHDRIMDGLPHYIYIYANVPMICVVSGKN